MNLGSTVSDGGAQELGGSHSTGNGYRLNLGGGGEDNCPDTPNLYQTMSLASQHTQSMQDSIIESTSSPPTQKSYLQRVALGSNPQAQQNTTSSPLRGTSDS